MAKNTPERIAAPIDEPEMSWSKYYALVRYEMAFRYGRRRIPMDRYKEEFALGRSVSHAARSIEQRLLSEGK